MAKKSRKKAKPAKAVKSKRKAVKAKVVKKAKKTKTAKKAKKTRKAPAKAAKLTRAPAKKAKKAKKKAKTKDVIGEGNYTASRNFRKNEESFVKKNKTKIPALAKAAEAALDGPEGAELEEARIETAAHGQE